jgi:hypothetical protein
MATHTNPAVDDISPYVEIIDEILPPKDISLIKSLWKRKMYPKGYDDACRRIIKSFHSAPPARRKKIAEALGIVSWIPCFNFRIPLYFMGTSLNPYFPTKKLQSLFDGVISVWFVDRSHSCLRGKKSQEVLEASGVFDVLHRLPALGGLSLEGRSKIRTLSGSEKFDDDWLNDYDIPALEKVLKLISDRRGDWKRRSFLLWDCLHDALHRHGVRFFYGDYAWYRGRKWRAARFPAQFVRMLKESAWLPGKDGRPKSPREVSVAELPASFRRKADPFIVKILEFESERKPKEVNRSKVDRGAEIVELGPRLPSIEEVSAQLDGVSRRGRTKQPSRST